MEELMKTVKTFKEYAEKVIEFAKKIKKKLEF